MLRYARHFVSAFLYPADESRTIQHQSLNPKRPKARGRLRNSFMAPSTGPGGLSQMLLMLVAAAGQKQYRRS